jgi:hypothetical protein
MAIGEDIYRQAFLKRQEEKKKKAMGETAEGLSRSGLFGDPVGQQAFTDIEKQSSQETADFEGALGLQKDKEATQIAEAEKSRQFESSEAEKVRLENRKLIYENRAFALSEQHKKEREARKKGVLGQIGMAIGTGAAALLTGGALLPMVLGAGLGSSVVSGSDVDLDPLITYLSMKEMGMLGDKSKAEDGPAR